MTRILTYNVHSCVGADRRLDVARVADVIAAEAPDIVALQEVDVGRERTRGVDQAHAIAERLGMRPHFNAAVRVEEERYGDAILTALPERLVKAGPLPGYRPLEPRGALWVAVETGGAAVQVINTHLGLTLPEQLAQVSALLGPDWLGAVPADAPLIFVGDLNTGMRGAACRRLRRRLKDARAVAVRGASTATFPSTMPVRRLDHVFTGGRLHVRAIHVATGLTARRASDHLPLVVDFDIDVAAAAEPGGRPAD